MDTGKNIIAEKSIEFSLQIIELYKQLVLGREYVISKQLLRSSTSIGANVMESQSTVSDREFYQKLSLALKEARETNYWLILLNRSQMIKLDYSQYIYKVEEIIKILAAITKTVKRKIVENQKRRGKAEIR